MAGGPMTVGWVGLGVQGAPMAERVLGAGVPIRLWARRTSTLVPFDRTAATMASSLAELAAASDVVCICVPDDGDVLEVAAALEPGLAPGTVVVIHSTVHPDTCRAVAALLADRETQVLDAPVSGGAVAARAGQLSIVVGGSPAAHDRALPVLRAYGDPVRHVGPLGAGQALKLLHNLCFTARLTLLEEVGRLGAELGVPIDVLAELVVGGRYSGLMEQVVLGQVAPPNAGRSRDTLTKDVGHAVALLRSRGLTSSALEELAASALRSLGTTAAGAHG